MTYLEQENKEIIELQSVKSAAPSDEPAPSPRGTTAGIMVIKCPVCTIQFITTDEVVTCIKGHVFHTSCYHHT